MKTMKIPELVKMKTTRDDIIPPDSDVIISI